jgi:hypothetical protein
MDVAVSDAVVDGTTVDATDAHNTPSDTQLPMDATTEDAVAFDSNVMDGEPLDHGAVLDVETPADADLHDVVDTVTEAEPDASAADVAPMSMYLFEAFEPADCDDLSSVPAVPGTGFEDGTTAALELPFLMPYWGSRMSHYSVATDGFVQLWSSGDVIPNRSAYNFSIPTEGIPDSVVAILWDDLSPTMNASIRATLVGDGSDRHFTIGWINYTFWDSSNDQLTFQIKLFETGMIEFHYCSLSGRGSQNRLTGGQATIGLEDPSGTRGVQFSYDTAGSIRSNGGIRFRVW